MPPDCSPEPFLRGNAHAVSQQALGLRDVGERVANVARARGGVGHLWLRSRQLPQQPHEIVDGHRATTADIERVTGSIGRPAGEQVRLYYVLDGHKVAGLLAVAEDREALASDKLADEARDYSGIGRVGVLARTEHVEVSQRDAREIV